MMTRNLKQGYKGITAVVLKGAMAVCGLILEGVKEDGVKNVLYEKVDL